MGNTSSQAAKSDSKSIYIVLPSRISYEENVKRIAEKNKWVRYSTHMDSFCSFYYDPAMKYLWVVQKIGDEELLITKPSDEYLNLVTRQYSINVEYATQPALFYGF